MDAKQLLSILEKEYSDENVEMAIAWLKTDGKPRKSADQILKKVFKHPRMQSELTWVADRCRKGSWSFVIQNLHGMRSIEQFEWILTLANKNPSHPDSGALWNALLREFRHEALVPDATEWTNHCDLEEYDAQIVLSSLLPLSPTETLVKKAKTSLDAKFNTFLLSSLIEHAADKHSIALGAKMLDANLQSWEKQFIATAMSKANFDAYKHHIYHFLNDPSNRDRTFDFLYELGIESTEYIPFICDWAEQNFGSRAAKEFCSKTRMFFVNSGTADKLWTWLNSTEVNEIRFEIFIRMFETSWCPLPDEAKDLVKRWLDENPKHRLRARVKKAYMRKPKVFLIITSKRKGQGTLSAETAKLFGLDGDTFDDTALQTARNWLDRAPGRHGADTVAAEIFHITQSAEDLIRFKAALEHASLSTRTWHLGEIVDCGNEEIISMSLEALNHKRLYLQYSSEYQGVGKLILGLLKVQPHNINVIEQAESWLRIPPTSSDKEVYSKVKEALIQRTADI